VGKRTLDQHKAMVVSMSLIPSGELKGGASGPDNLRPFLVSMSLIPSGELKADCALDLLNPLALYQ